jgi:hypothetical protein
MNNPKTYDGGTGHANPVEIQISVNVTDINLTTIIALILTDACRCTVRDDENLVAISARAKKITKKEVENKLKDLLWERGTTGLDYAETDDLFNYAQAGDDIARQTGARLFPAFYKNYLK